MDTIRSAWESHPDHPAEDWQAEVANDDTRLGYLDWLAGRLIADINHAAERSRRSLDDRILAGMGHMRDRHDDPFGEGADR